VRVIGGRLRGRRLQAPRGGELRPTSDRVREALFDILAGRVPDSEFLDLYAGTGAVGIEALSRGAGRATFVEQRTGHLVVLRANLEACGLDRTARVLGMDVGRGLRRLAGEAVRFSVVFLDPPYGVAGERIRALERLARSPLLAPEALVVVEGPARAEPAGAVGMERTRVARYGDTALAFYRRSGG
jgi:16S rRNA (guanine(966)-N(2))-methyltransferase RsmD